MYVCIYIYVCVYGHICIFMSICMFVLMLLNCGVEEGSWRAPWTTRRSNQSILKEINPEYSWEELMLKLKLRFFGHVMWRADSLERPWCWERLRAGGEEGDRGWDSSMASSTQWTWVWANQGDSEGQGSQPRCTPWGHKETWLTD